MRAWIFSIVIAASACTSGGTYVAAVYQDGTQLSVKVCDLSNNDTPNPTSCHIELVGPTPTDELAVPSAPTTALELMKQATVR